jgi:hypothetical protein
LAAEREIFLRKLRIKPSERKQMMAQAHGHKFADGIPDCVAYIDDLREEDHRVQAFFADTYVDERDANPAFGFTARRIYGSRPGP